MGGLLGGKLAGRGGGAAEVPRILSASIFSQYLRTFPLPRS